MDPTRLLQKLVVQDAALSQGEIVYTREDHHALPAPSADRIADQERRRLLGVMDGRSEVGASELTSRLDQIRRDAAYAHLAANARYEGTILYARDGRFCHTVTSFLTGLPPTTTTHIYDGEDQVLLPVGGNQVTVFPGRPVDLHPAKRMVGMYPGASFMLGRALSLLQDASCDSLPETVRLHGKASDGTLISAILDPAHDLVATQIDRYSQDRLLGRITLEKTVQFGAGPWLASAAHYTGYSGGKPVIDTKYTLVAFRDLEPDAAVFHVPFRQGALVSDHRLGTRVQFRQTQPGALTKAHILRISRATLDQQAAPVENEE